MDIAALNWLKDEGRKPEKDTAERGASPADDGFTTFIAPGAEFEGQLVIGSSIRIDGEYKGELVSKETVVIGENANVEASIRAKNVIIQGAVAGDVTATRELTLTNSGRLKGSVETPSLMVAKGAVFNGTTKMGRPDVAARNLSSTQTQTGARAQRQPTAVGTTPSTGTGL
jgi:cytoskeletal protein CcmA (bactofilin family)